MSQTVKDHPTIPIEQMRTHYPGYIGGAEIARKATDEEINALVRLRDLYGDKFREAMEAEMLFKNLVKCIEKREG